MIKILFVLLLLVLLFGGGAKMIVAGGAKSLNMADRLLGQGDGARLLLADQPYGRGPRQSLDIWVPDSIEEGDRLPVVIFFYGGGWDSGDRDSYGFAGRALARRGFIVVVPDYRLVPKAYWPDYIEDGAAAVAWTHEHIAKLGGDPDRIALMGHSAGAYNAAMIALDPQWLRAVKSDPSIIRGVAGLAGPYDFLPLEKGGRGDRAMGKVKPIERTQPIHFARGDAPPMWLATGDEDDTVRPRNSQNLA
ncbi:MAG: alpha/beta hydrolase, partial [Sphingopyxis sp.]|nr:alpha/beta hydrolase [Sphingopyxis sp.]